MQYRVAGLAPQGARLAAPGFAGCALAPLRRDAGREGVPRNWRYPMRLHFDLTLVQRLLTHAKDAPEHRPTFDQMCDGQFRRDGKNFDFDRSRADFPTS